MISRLNKIKNYIINTYYNPINQNKGFSIVMVIVAIAFVGILGATILMLAMTNLQMKYTDLEAKRTFYSAEIAMDQIKTGLQEDVSNAYAKAYSEALEKYTSETDIEREKNFKDNFINNIKSILLIDDKYKLSQYLNNNVKINSELNSNIKMSVDDLGIHLQDIKITYTDKKGVVSIIQTDITILAPPIDLFTTTKNDTIKISDYIIYENWSKQ